MTSLAIVAVPIFFVITGYFLYTSDPDRLVSRSRKMLGKIAKVWLTTNLIYFAFHTILGKRLYTSWDAVVELLLWGTTNEGLLWYLLALFYTIVIIYGLAYFRISKLIDYLPILLFPTILLGRYAFLLGAEGTILLDFNVLMTGLPYVSLGYCVHKYEEKLMKWNWELLSLLFLALNAIEVAALEASSEFYFGRYFFTMPLALSILCLFLSNKSWGANTFAERIGRDYAGNIYYLHALVIYVFRFWIDRLGWFDGYYQSVGFIYVFFVTLALSWVVVKVQNHFGWNILR